MQRVALIGVLLIGGVLHAEGPSAGIVVPDYSFASQQPCPGCVDGSMAACAPPTSPERGFLQSDKAFERFIGPMSSPILSKDPRSLTEIRGLFIQNWFPGDNPLFNGGDFQAYAAQVRIALTERITLIADKDGIASLSPRGFPTQQGLLAIAAGLKYTVIRDVENQTLLTIGAMYELPSGDAKVFQNHGDGIWTVFMTAGQEFGEYWHVLFNSAYQFGQNSNQNSSFWFNQIHIDRQVLGFLYPLVEFNCYSYFSGGARGIPSFVGEGDGLINLGTNGMSGRNLVTAALGLKARINWNIETGIVYEIPLTPARENLLQNRLMAEIIFRY